MFLKVTSQVAPGHPGSGEAKGYRVSLLGVQSVLVFLPLSMPLPVWPPSRPNHRAVTSPHFSICSQENKNFNARNKVFVSKHFFILWKKQFPKQTEEASLCFSVTMANESCTLSAQETTQRGMGREPGRLLSTPSLELTGTRAWCSTAATT